MRNTDSGQGRSRPLARRLDGKTIEPHDAIVPILQEVAYRRLKVIGTGFYISRYGLFATARHVLLELCDLTAQKICTAFVLHVPDEERLHLRRIRQISMLNHEHAPDIGIGQADNYAEKFPLDPLMNLRPSLTTVAPSIGSSLITFAYPENEILDFNFGEPPHIVADYYRGRMLHHVGENQRPFIRCPHYETTLEIKSGASGGPVFDETGRIVGVNCRGWDFRGAEHEGDHLSSVVPIGAMLPIELDLVHVPVHSWEYQQIPQDRIGSPFSALELARLGHFVFDPAV